MPKYLVTSGSVFEPFSYEELVRPVAQMQELHNRAADEYDAMALDTDSLDKLISADTDVRTRQMYDDYRTKLKTLQDNLYERGYSSNTRRELTAARNAYANIGTIKTALQNRQDLAKRYREAKEKNPDLLMGADPMSYSLDDYLDGKTPGYYSYDGNTLAKNIGVDAKAAGAEMSRNPMYMKNPYMAGYITRIINEGFTNQEVDNAVYAAYMAYTGDSSILEKLNPGEQTLAGILLNHIGATGAHGKLDPAEVQRMFAYGASGLRQAVGGAKYQDRRITKGSGSGSGSGYGPGSLGNGYHLEGSYVDLSNLRATKDADKINRLLFEQGEDGSYSQKQFVINNQVYSPKTFKDIDDILKNASPYFFQLDEKPVYGRTATGTVTDPSGNEHEIRVYMDKDLITRVQRKTEKGIWVEDANLTREYNNGDPAYDPIKDIARLKKLYKEYDIPMTVPFTDAFKIIDTLSNQGDKTPASLAPAEEAFASTRSDYYRKIKDAFDGHGGEKQKEATSKYGFYKVNPKDRSVESKPTFKWDEVFGKDGIRSISMVPESFVDNPRGRLRIQTAKGTFEVNPEMIGPEFASSMEKIAPIVKAAMSPMSSTSMAYQGKGDTDWHQAMTTIMSKLYPDQRNMWNKIRIADVVLDQDLQKRVREYVTKFMNIALAAHRESMGNNNYQHRGNTSSKATENNYYYNDYDDED